MRYPLFAFVLLASSLAAQRTWIVDAFNGAGTDFTDIEPAVDAAADGDTVLVRRGAYTNFAIVAKSVNVIAAAGAQPSVRRPSNPPFPIVYPIVEIRYLTAAQTVTIRGLAITSSDWQRAIVIGNCEGPVHLDNVATRDVANEEPIGGSQIESCRLVTIANSSLIGGRPALAVTSSGLAIAGGSIVGSSAMSLVHTSFVFPHPGLRLQASTASLASTSVAGGDGIYLQFWRISPVPAIEVVTSALTISGDATNLIAAGRDRYPTGVPVSAIVSGTTALVIESTIHFEPVNGAPAVTGSAQFRRVVGLRAGVAPTGDALTGQILSPTGDLFVLLAGAPRLGAPTPIGALFVDAWIVPVRGTQEATERFAFNVPVPNLPTLQRRPVALQAANLYAATGLLELSNPIVVTVFP